MSSLCDAPTLLAAIRKPLFEKPKHLKIHLMFSTVTSQKHEYAQLVCCSFSKELHSWPRAPLIWQCSATTTQSFPPTIYIIYPEISDNSAFNHTRVVIHQVFSIVLKMQHKYFLCWCTICSKSCSWEILTLPKWMWNTTNQERSKFEHTITWWMRTICGANRK